MKIYSPKQSAGLCPPQISKYYIQLLVDGFTNCVHCAGCAVGGLYHLKTTWLPGVAPNTGLPS